MTFFVNLGYQFKLPGDVIPDGSILAASTMPMHQLQRRRIDKRYPHLNRRLFDPQLYLVGLDAFQSPKPCVKLATYPWIETNKEFDTYKSNLQTQQKWTEKALKQISAIWKQEEPKGETRIKEALEDCVEFQTSIGVEGIILPSILTSDLSTDYSVERDWLDLGIKVVRKQEDAAVLPVYATVAISDVCLTLVKPEENTLLEMITDVVSSREIDGVYLVVEQGGESDDVRCMTAKRSCRSLLELVHTFSKEAKLKVLVNYAGQFGFACRGAGADTWSSGWYKSLHRLRIRDKLQTGRAYPSFWSHRAAIDIHLEKDFDKIVKAGLLNHIRSGTLASKTLMEAAKKGVKVESVLPWRYRQSNVSTCREHYLQASINVEKKLKKKTDAKIRDTISKWLADAEDGTKKLESVLDVNRKTKISHVESWSSAFEDYRNNHGF